MTLPHGHIHEKGKRVAPWRNVTLALGIVAIPFIFALHNLTARGRQVPPGFGEKIGEFNGVAAYSNGRCNPKYSSGEKQYHKEYITGFKWQCCEYVVRYYKQVYNLEVRGGDAWEWFDLAGEKGLDAFKNGSEIKPAPGDILCSDVGYFGHVAIIRAVGPDYVEVIHQNWKNDGQDAAYRCPMVVKDARYWVRPFKHSYYEWQGWLRPPPEVDIRDIQ